jgi:cysteine-rich repeat protein
MYHIRNFRRKGWMTVIAVVALGAASASAQSDPASCRVEITKQLAKYEGSVNKILNKCEQAIVKGKIATTCEADTDTQAAIAKAAGKVATALTAKCVGLNFQQTGWADCPDFQGAGCDATFTGSYQKGICDGGANEGKNCTTDAGCPASTCTISVSLSTPADETEIADCVVCNADANVAAYMDLVYDAFAPSGSDADLNKCQQEVGKQLSKFLGAYSKEAGKCRKVRPSQGGTCPETKSIAKLTKTFGKVLEGVLVKKCSSFSAAQIGLAGTCPSAANSGLGTQASDCSDIAISTVESFLDCAACNATQTAFNEFSGTCGNGVTDFEVGETCDDGNTVDNDACPSDCRVSDCRIDPKGKTVDVQVAFSVPVGEEVAALEAFVVYPERAVTLPGSGNVSTSVTGTPADTSVTVNDTNAGLSIVATDDDGADAITPGALFTATFTACSSLPKDQPILIAQWEGAKVKGAKADDFVCVVESAIDTNLDPVDGVTCSVVFP